MDTFRETAETEGVSYAKALIAGETEPVFSREQMVLAIEKYAEVRFKDWPVPLTKAQRFSKAMDTPAGNLLFQAAKASPPASDSQQDPTPQSAMARLRELARQHNQAHPSLSPEQSFAAVYTSRNHVDLKRIVVAGQGARARSFHSPPAHRGNR